LHCSIVVRRQPLASAVLHYVPMRRVRAEVRCLHCGFAAREDALDLLRRAGMLKRAGDDVDEHLVIALLSSAGPRLECAQCGQTGMQSAQCDTEEDASDWPATTTTKKSCQMCGQPIEIERRRLLPDNEYCASCQQQRESGVAAEDHREFCPWCGQVLLDKTTRRRGVTEYRPACPSCGYVG